MSEGLRHEEAYDLEEPELAPMRSRHRSNAHAHIDWQPHLPPEDVPLHRMGTRRLERERQEAKEKVRRWLAGQP